MSMGRGMRGNMYLSEEEKKNAPKMTKGLIVRIFSYLKPYWLRLFLSFAAIIIAAILDVLPSILTGRIIDDGFIKGNFNLIIQLILLSLVVLTSSSLLGVYENYLNTWVSEHICRDMKNEMYEHLTLMSQRFFSTNKQGDIITRMTTDISGVRSAISSTLTNTISNLAVLATSLFAMFQKNWLLAIVGFLILPLFILPTKSVGKKRWELTLLSQAKSDEVNQILNETLSVSGQQLVKLFTNEETEIAKYHEVNHAITDLNIKESMAGRWFRMAISTFTNMGPMLIYLLGAVLILKMNTPGLSVGDITVMVSLLTRMYRPVTSLLNIQVEFTRALALFSRIFGYLDMPVEIANKENAKVLSKVKGKIVYDKVYFQYEADRMTLKNISFTIPPKSMTAIVGPSGSGKSTIVNLLVRLYDLTKGKITIDDVDITDLDLKYLRSLIGMVSQEAYLFNGTIRENLLYAKADASDAELIRVCEEANIYDFIQTLPDGLETIVGNRGMKLSGGEKQRLAIARAILKDPLITIFDEATSSLDSISEDIIQTAIEPLLKGHTSLVIAHRLSTIMAADQILVVKDGEIVERGTHETLVDAGGTYQELYQTQFKRVLNDQN
ncbi:MAG: ABC transporter ATP-binding protein/permease [Erysipelotrichaceae bacterium]|jgi:ATP-binding cassette subfamily B protein|nr:ABC transporter ATP-binding protein/permease [Erysipelotrichaceae bacterium]